MDDNARLDEVRDEMRKRLKQRKLTAKALSAMIGRSPGYVSEFLSGKKSDFRPSDRSQIAAILGLSEQYLEGARVEPTGGDTSGMRLFGVIEANTWRSDADQGHAFGTSPIAPDPRYPAPELKAYLVADDHAAWLGVSPRQVVQAWDTTRAGVVHGDPVVVRSTDPAKGVELTIQQYLGQSLIRHTPSGKAVATSPSTVEMLGVVVSATTVFARGRA